MNRQHALVVLSLALAPILSSTYGRPPGTPVPPTPAPTPTPQLPGDLLPRIAQLETTVSQSLSMMEVQSRAFGAAIARIESNANVVLIFLAVAAVLITLLGFGIVRGWVSSLVQARLEQMSREEIDQTIQAEVKKLRAEWETKFAQIYDEYRKSLRR